jgi:CelD/BcsL family acetyltransferase involved in cellulose biosynthesis
MTMSRTQRRAFKAGPAEGDSQLVDPIADARWEDFIARAPQANAFHHPAWLELLRRSYGYPIQALCVVDEAGAVRAGLPMALVGGGLRRARLASLPFSDECVLLTAADGEPELTAKLTEALNALRRRLGLPLEVRGPLDGAASSQIVDSYHQHDIALEPDFDAVVQRFRRRSQLMRGVRRAEREGLTVERRTDTSALADFYSLHLATRHRQGVPTQPRSFILRFGDLFDRGLGFVMVVRDGDQPIAAAVFLAFNGTLTYKYGASDAAALSKRPNNLLFLEAIRWGCEAGMHTLDLGRTDIGHESLREFKLSWGAEERTLSYHELSDRQQRDAPGAGVAHRVAPLIRRSPPVVGRLVGAALYRYAG